MQTALDQVTALLEGRNEETPTTEKADDNDTHVIDALQAGNEGDNPAGDEGEPDAIQTEGQGGEKAPDGLDYGLAIPLGNGRDATLGELKDAYNRAEMREVEVQEREAAILRQNVELDEVLNSVMDQLPPQLRSAAAEHLSRTHARAAAAVLEAIPQWREETARQADFGMIQELADSYGLGAHVAHTLKYPSHPGTLQLLRDFARLRDTVRKAGGKLKAAQAQHSKITPANVSRQDEGKALAQRAKQSGKVGDQIAAVSQLLRGK